jgi:peptidoglycan/LPS O-acetylase OafA/YrhL
VFPKSGTRINEIDLLRFIAAMMVVFYHYCFRGYAADELSVMPYPLLASVSKFGYLGVDLFFIISGFVILMTAAGGSLKNFVVSRITRLFPAFWACCSITFILTLVIGAPRFSASIKQYLINMTMMSGFVGVSSIDGSYWSLFIEMKFYFLVALVLLAGMIDRAQAFLAMWLLVSIGSIIIPKLDSIFITDYSAYFIAGATFFLVWSKGISKTRVALILACWCLALFRSYERLAGIEKHYHIDMNPYVVFLFITVFFITMTMISTKRTGFWGRKTWLLVGSITYPLYLLHHNIGFMIFNVAFPKINQHVILYGTITLMLGTSYAVHIMIERRYAKPMKNMLYQSLQALQNVSNNIVKSIKSTA